MYKILVVEDEELIRKGLVYAYDWASANCVVVGEADNGVAGEEAIHRLLPDIVITDINMPLADGLKMMEETMQSCVYSAIVISGYDEFSLAQKAMRLGVSEYLLKPIEFDNLTLALERAKQQLEQRKLYLHAKEKGENVDPFDLLRGANLGIVASNRVKRMLEYIHANYAHKISIHELEEILHTSSSYLNQKFKDETSYTFNEYLNRYRIMQAIQMIRNDDNDRKIYAIAEVVGFSDYKYFISVFKKYVNISPKKFAEKYMD